MSKSTLKRQKKEKTKEFHWISVHTGELETSLFSAIRVSLFAKRLRPKLFSWRHFKSFNDIERIFKKCTHN